MADPQWIDPSSCGFTSKTESIGLELIEISPLRRSSSGLRSVREDKLAGNDDEVTTMTTNKRLGAWSLRWARFSLQVVLNSLYPEPHPIIRRGSHKANCAGISQWHSRQLFLLDHNWITLLNPQAKFYSSPAWTFESTRDLLRQEKKKER